MSIKFLTASILGLAFVAITATTPPALAASTVIYTTALSGSEEVPPTTSKGTGSADVTYDPSSKKLTWKVTFSALTGPATAAHFHGPAAHGANADPAVPIPGTASPLTGSATLTAAQEADLAAGKWYVNVHTAANKGGEIRGWLKKK